MFSFKVSVEDSLVRFTLCTVAASEVEFCSLSNQSPCCVWVSHEVVKSHIRVRICMITSAAFSD